MMADPSSRCNVSKADFYFVSPWSLLCNGANLKKLVTNKMDPLYQLPSQYMLIGSMHPVFHFETAKTSIRTAKNFQLIRVRAPDKTCSIKRDIPENKSNMKLRRRFTQRGG